MSFAIPTIVSGLLLGYWMKINRWSEKECMLDKMIYDILLIKGGLLIISPNKQLKLIKVGQATTLEKQSYEVAYIEDGIEKEVKKISIDIENKAVIRFDEKWENEIKKALKKQCIIHKISGVF